MDSQRSVSHQSDNQDALLKASAAVQSFASPNILTREFNLASQKHNRFITKEWFDMRKLITRTLVLLFVGALTALMANDSMKHTVSAGKLATDPNPLLGEWAGRYGGVPPFDKVQVAL